MGPLILSIGGNWRRRVGFGLATEKMDNANPTNSRPEGSLRGFWSLFITQFQGAFSDNLYKFLAIFFVMKSFEENTEKIDSLIPVIGAMFSVPFIVFSLAGGYLSDRYSKKMVAVGTKVAEVLIMVLATFALMQGNVVFIVGVIFLMSTQSAFFGPAKYGSLPELLPAEKLAWGNGVIGMGTNMAIILGMVAAGFISSRPNVTPAAAGLVLVGLAVAGLLCSLFIPRIPSSNVTKRFRINFAGELFRQVKRIYPDRPLFFAVMGEMFFFFIAAMIQLHIVIYGKEVLALDDLWSSYLQATIAVGIGTGCLVAGFVSGNKTEYGLIPLGALGMVVFSCLMSVENPGIAWAFFNIGALGFAGGFFLVPIYALIQQRPDKKDKGTVVGASATLTFVGILLSAGAYYLLTSDNVLGLSAQQTFLAIGVLMFLGTTYIVYLLPDSLVRLVGFFVTRTIYRLNIVGRDNIPERGGALFVCNHLSFIDVLLLQSSTDRPIRFIMYAGYMKQKVLGTFARIMRCIPISSESRPRDLIKSLKVASQAIRDGEVVCIFAEGQITRTGQMLPFRRGYEKIMKDVDAPIIPIHLDGVWGSIFSYSRSRFFFKLPRRIPYRVTVSYGAALPHDAPPVKVREAVQELGADAWAHRKRTMKPLHRSLVRAFRKHPFRFFAADAKRGKVSCGGALVGTVALGQALRRQVGGAGDGGHPHAADGGRCAGQLRRLADGQSAGEPQLHILVGGAGFVHRAVQYPHGGHVESVPRADQARRAGGDDFAGGRRQIDRRRQQTRRRPGLSAVAGWPVGEVSRQQTQGVDGRLGHGHFLERQHRRAQGRDALALQRRLEHSADWPGVCAGSERPDSRHPAVFPLVRLHRHVVAAAAAWLGCGVSPEPGRRAGYR